MKPVLFSILIFIAVKGFSQIIITNGDSIVITEGVKMLYFNVLDEKYDSLWRTVGVENGRIVDEGINTETKFEFVDDSTINVEWVNSFRGTVFQKGKFVNGLAEDVFTISFGNTVSSVYFKNGKKNGVEIIDMGKSKWVTYYENGLKSGPRYLLDTETNIISHIEHYSENLLHGTMADYWVGEMGEISLRYHYQYLCGKPVNGVYTFYHDGLVWIQGRYRNGEKKGWEKTYNGYGQVVRKVYFKKGKATRHKKYERDLKVE